MTKGGFPIMVGGIWGLLVAALLESTQAVSSMRIERNPHSDYRTIVLEQLKHHRSRALDFESSHPHLQQGYERLLRWKEPAIKMHHRRQLDDAFNPLPPQQEPMPPANGTLVPPENNENLPGNDTAPADFPLPTNNTVPGDSPLPTNYSVPGDNPLPTNNTVPGDNLPPANDTVPGDNPLPGNDTFPENQTGTNNTTPVPPPMPNNTEPAEPSGYSSPTTSPGPDAPHNRAYSTHISNCHLDFYTARIGLGVPRQDFLLVVDTSRTDLWVMASDCTTCYNAMNKYDGSLSNTFRPEQDDRIRYQTNPNSPRPVTGRWAYDTVFLTDELVVPGHAFVQLETFPPEHLDGDCSGWDGYLGLAPPVDGSDKPILNHLRDEDLLEKGLFSLYLDTQDDYTARDIENPLEPVGEQPERASSELIWGGVRGSNYHGCLNWHYVVDLPGELPKQAPVAWTFELLYAKSGEASLPGSDLVIVDTETAFTVGPYEAVKAFALENNLKCLAPGQFFRNQLSDVPCDNPNGFQTLYALCDAPLKPLEFHASEDVTYVLGKDTLFLPVNPEALGFDDETDEKYCLVTVLPLNAQLNAWLVGSQFLQSYYAAFDFINDRIGFAPRRKMMEAATEACADDAEIDIESDGIVPPPSSPAVPVPPTPAPVEVPYNPFPPTPVPTPGPTFEKHTEQPHKAFNPILPPPPPVPVPPPTPPSVENSFPKNQQTQTEESAPNKALPAILGLAVVGLLVFIVMRRRRQQRYQRAASLFDDYYKSGDMELREFA